MLCTSPLVAYKSDAFAFESGAPPLIFEEQFKDRIHALRLSSDHFKKVYLPCRKCTGCRVNQAGQKAMRVSHESMYHEKSCFITLTYNPACLPADGQLLVEDFQKFMMRLRSWIKRHIPGNPKIKVLYCGEYGPSLLRPHFHAILFGIDFCEYVNKDVYSKPNDIQYYNKDLGYFCFRSKILTDDIWKKGFCTVGTANYTSAAYVCRYVTKKITGPAAEDHYNGRIPEFSHQSLGIGKQFALDNYASILANGKLVPPGKHYSVKIPRYYLNKIGELAFDNDDVSRALQYYYSRQENYRPHENNVRYANGDVKWHALDNLHESSLEMFSKFIRSFEMELEL